MRHLLKSLEAVVGYYADHNESRKGPYLLGLIFLAISTVAISLSRTTGIFFVGRLIQGASSASVHAVGMAILADTVGDAGAGAAMGFITMMMALGAVFGPMVGGLLYHNFGYFAVFFSAYGLVAVDVALRLLMVERNARNQRTDITGDTQSYGTFVEDSIPESCFPVLDGHGQQHDEHHPKSPPSPSSLHISFDSTKPSQLDGQIAKRHPMLELLATPRMLAAILGDFMQSLVLTGLETILPLRIKIVFHYNSQNVAFVFLVLAIPYMAGPYIGKLGDIYGPKAIVSAGFAILMPLVILLRLIDHFEAGQVALLCVLLFAIGIALNMILAPVWSDTIYLVNEKATKDPGIFGNKGAYAQAFGLMNMAYAIGSVIGPLLGGWLMEKVGWSWITLGAGILSGICVIPCIMYTGGRLPRNA